MSKILKEFNNLEAGMKDVNKPIFNNPGNKKRSRELDVAVMMFFKNAIILKEFISNPVQSCNDITRIHSDLPYSKDFVELTKALNCSHTKEQGTTIGVKKIVEYIGKVKEECITKSNGLEDKVKEAIEVIDGVKELTNNSFDYDTLARRYQQATENDYFSNHTANNVDKILVPEAIAVGPTMSVNKFLKTILRVYPNGNKNKFGLLFNSLKDLIKDVVGKKTYIDANNKYLFTTQFNKTRFEYSDFTKDLSSIGTDKKNIYYKEVIQSEFEQLPKFDDPADKLAILKDLVEVTKDKVSHSINAFDNLSTAYNDLSSAVSNLSIQELLNTIYTTVIEPMGNMTITVDEYSKKLDDYKLVIQNILTLRDRVETFLELVKNAPNNFFFLDDKIYKLIDKILVKSTMYKGQENKPQVIINDGTQK